MAKMSFIIYFQKRVQYLLSGHHAQQHRALLFACCHKSYFSRTLREAVAGGSGGHSSVRTNFWFSHISTMLILDFHLIKLSPSNFSFASKAIIGFEDMIAEINEKNNQHD